MKKIYSILLALLTLVGVAQAQTITVTPTAASGEMEGISFETAKNNGSTAPSYVANGKDLRIYAKGSITITSSVGNMKQIVFNISAQGLKRLAPITADKGEIAAQAAGDATVTWTGDASTVTLTVGEKAEYGSEGNTKAGQFDFTDFVVMVGDVNPDYVATPKITPPSGTYYAAQEVTITADEGCTIYYTTDGGDPAASDAIYNGSFTVTETTTVRAIAVKGDNKSEETRSIITITTLSTQTIAQVLAGGAADAASTTATVVAACKSGLLLGDGTGYIFVYTGSVPTVEVGDVVSVSGKVSEYGGCLQFSQPEVSKTGTASVTYPDAREIDGATLDALVNAPAVTYVKVAGTLSISGNFYNLKVDGATAQGSILATDAVLSSLVDGTKITVTGFFVYQSSNKKYANIIVTSIDAPQVEYTEYNTLAAAKAAVSDETSYAQLNLNNILVSYVHGQSVYLFDGTDGMLISGTNSKNLKTGDKISGTIKGQLLKEKGNTQISSPNYDVTVASSGNEVVPQAVTSEDFKANGASYENELITLTDVVPTAEAWENQKLSFDVYDEAFEKVIANVYVFDKWKVATNLTFDKDMPYTVTGLVSLYMQVGSTAPQIEIYPRSAADLDNGEEPAPSITPATGTYYSAQTVTITASEGAQIYYTTDGNDPSASDALYAGPFTVSETTTVKAVAVKDGKMSGVTTSVITITSAPTDNGDGSLENPYNFIGANNAASALASGAKSDDVYVKGKISEIKFSFDAEHGTATFFITDDGNKADNQFQVYATKYLGNRAWKDGDKNIALGDDVIIYGKLTNFKGTTPETASGESCLYSLNGEKAPDVVYTEYNTLAAAKAAVSNEEIAAQLNLTNILVSYVNGQSVYLFDGTDGMLVFGTNSKNLKAGDKISGTIKGQLYKRYGNTQIASPNYDDVTVVSSGNEVVPQTVTAEDFKANGATYENELITLTDLLPVATAWENRNISFDAYDEAFEKVVVSVTVRDNWSVATSMTFDENTTYSVTGFVSIYVKDATTPALIQLYPRSAADIDDGTVPVPYEFVGDGTLENPYTVEDIRHKEATETKTALEKDVWVKAYIVGYINGSSLSDKTAVFSAEPTEEVKDGQPVTYPVAASNVLVADAADVKDIANVIAIALQTGSPRTDLNLADNPTKLGTQVWLKGGIYKYMGVPGLKDVKFYSLDGETIVAVDGIAVDPASEAKTIYTIAGQRVQNLNKRGLYIVNGKKVVVK